MTIQYNKSRKTKKKDHNHPIILNTFFKKSKCAEVYELDLTASESIGTSIVDCSHNFQQSTVAGFQTLCGSDWL